MLCHRIGSAWQGLGSRGATGVTSLRRSQKLPLVQKNTRHIPCWPRLSPQQQWQHLWDKELRKGDKTAQLYLGRGGRMWERKSPAGPQVRAGGVQAVELGFLCSPW